MCDILKLNPYFFKEITNLISNFSCLFPREIDDDDYEECEEFVYIDDFNVRDNDLKRILWRDSPDILIKFFPKLTFLSISRNEKRKITLQTKQLKIPATLTKLNIEACLADKIMFEENSQTQLKSLIVRDSKTYNDFILILKKFFEHMLKKGWSLVYISDSWEKWLKDGKKLTNGTIGDIKQNGIRLFVAKNGYPYDFTEAQREELGAFLPGFVIRQWGKK